MTKTLGTDHYRVFFFERPEKFNNDLVQHLATSSCAHFVFIVFLIKNKKYGHREIIKTNLIVT